MFNKFNLSISNIAWSCENDEAVYKIMKEYGFTGMEIAPTRIFPANPYEHLDEAKSWSENLREMYGFCVPSIQSIWYGRNESIFSSVEERDALIQYTKKAIDFAEVIRCRNLVFGCPRNRNLPDESNAPSAIGFFKELGDYAAKHQTIVAMEANPPIYNTNYINTTKQAIELIKQVNSAGFALNLDLGTMIHNGEAITILEGNIKYINHVHISEPGLKLIEKRELHKELAVFLKANKYQNFISIEMGRQDNIDKILETFSYVREIFE